MKYFLRQNSMGAKPKVEIGEDVYNLIDLSLHNVLNCIKFEEEWDVLVGNAFLMERDILEVALYDMMYSDLDWDEFNDLRVKFIRHMANLLGSCRSYLDHSPQSLNKIDGSKNLSLAFKSETNRVYDTSFAYRFMEALRNHAQHNGHPVHGINFNASRVERGEEVLWQYIAGASINVQTLSENVKFKPSVLAEAQQRGGTVDAVSLAREYVEKLGDVHMAIRKLISDGLYVDRKPVSDALKLYEGSGGDTFALHAFSEHPDGSIGTQRAVLINPFDRYDKLCRKNGSLRNFSKRYASGELRAPKRR